MSRIEANKTFDNKTIRVVRDNEQQEWYFSVVDVVEVLADSTNPTDYLKKLRKRNPELHAYIGTTVRFFRTVQKEGDKNALYHFGASFKDLGKRLFAFELMGIDKNIILSQL